MIFAASCRYSYTAYSNAEVRTPAGIWVCSEASSVGVSLDAPEYVFLVDLAEAFLAVVAALALVVLGLVFFAAFVVEATAAGTTYTLAAVGVALAVQTQLPSIYAQA